MYRETVDCRFFPKGTFRAVWAAVILGCSVLCASAAPDPDLFDGRQAVELSEKAESSSENAAGGGGRQGESSGGSPSGGGKESPSSGRFSGSEAVSGRSSKTGVGGSGPRFDKQTAENEGQAAENEGQAGGRSSGGREPGTARDFSSFEVGGAGAVEAVEVNRSKSGSQRTTPTDLPSEPSATKQDDVATGTGQTQGGGSQPAVGAAGGDYGTDIPSGL